jgi:phosphopentomutase
VRRRAVILVLDGVGAGEAPDTASYGDAGSDTLRNVARGMGGLSLPNLQALGLGNLGGIEGVPPVDDPEGSWGVMRPASAGKDSTTGHWEIAGLHLPRAFPTYPKGFPPEVVDAFARATGRGVLANRPASGTEVIERFGAEHERTGKWIVYTSADSVFQVAAHESVVPLAELYAACEAARKLLVAPHDVSRVIARPFTTTDGVYTRTKNRRDYSIAPPGETLWGLSRGGREGGRPVRRALDSRAPHRGQRGWHPGHPAMAGNGAGWVALRQPSRFRHSVRPPGRRGRLRERAAAV